MPSIKYKGHEIYFDSLEEAIAAIDVIASTDGAAVSQVRRISASEGRWTVSRFRDFVGRLSAPQTKLLQELVTSPHGKVGKDLAQTLGFKSPKAFGPVLAAMSKHAKKTGIAFNEVLMSTRITIGNDQDTEFKATDAFIQIALEAGWRSGGK